MDQSDCGMCWSIGSIQTLSDIFSISTNSKVDLSIHHAYNCLHQLGCQGGSPIELIEYLILNGVPTKTCAQINWRNIPTKKQPCGCTKLSSYQFYHPDKNYYVMGVDKTDSDYQEQIKIIKLWIKTYGPVIGGFVSTLGYEENDGLYKETQGVYMDSYPYIKNYAQITGCHIVSVVGWGQQKVNNKEVEYWVVRNSWGDYWGDGGYYKMAMYPYNSKHSLLLSSSSDLGGFILLKPGKIEIKSSAEKIRRFKSTLITGKRILFILLLILVSSFIVVKFVI